MATISKRKLANGSIRYRVQIRIQRDGETHKESHTFTKRTDAKRFGDKRELELLEQFDNKKVVTGVAPSIKVIGKREDNYITISRLIELYEEKAKPLTPWGRSKQSVLNAMKRHPLFETPVSAFDSSFLVEYARVRRTQDGAKPQTVKQDISFLRSVFGVAKELLGVNTSVQPFNDAAHTMKTLNLVSSGGSRARRPEVDELSDIMEAAFKSVTSRRNHRRDVARIDRVIVFAMFSSRRQEEITKLQRKDFDKKNKRILVRNMKDPNRSEGNDVWCDLTDEAIAVLESMPDTGELFFPYNSRSLGSAFRKLRTACGLSYEDEHESLRFHDLRHECLSWLAEKNGLDGEHWDLVRIRQVSGHRSFTQLERYVNKISQTPEDRWKDWEWKTKVLEY